MSVKASVSISEQQDAFARSLVQEGRYSSVSAVIQHSLDLLKAKADRDDAELNAIRAFIADRRDGAFEPSEDARNTTRDMIARKRQAHGL
jgi:antitoxin ParD1/3/4